MGLFKGGALRLFQTLLYALAFCCAGIVLGIFSYFLAVLADRDLPIATWKKAVEGMSGAAVLYTIATTLLTCCLAGITFLSLLGLVLDLCFMGCFIAIAILTRHGASSCKGNVQTPLGNGPANSRNGFGAGGFGFRSGENSTYAPKLGFACRLNTAVFAVSIAAAVLFFITALMQLALMRHHKKEKKFGPSPANDYTSGTEKRNRAALFGRKNKTAPLPVHADEAVVGNDRHLAPVAGSTMRPSHDTAYSGHTAVGGNGQTVIQKEGLTHDGLHAPHVGHNPHSTLETSGYYTTPTGTTIIPSGGVARDF